MFFLSLVWSVDFPRINDEIKKLFIIINLLNIYVSMAIDLFIPSHSIFFFKKQFPHEKSLEGSKMTGICWREFLETNVRKIWSKEDWF